MSHSPWYRRIQTHACRQACILYSSREINKALINLTPQSHWQVESSHAGAVGGQASPGHSPRVPQPSPGVGHADEDRSANTPSPGLRVAHKGAERHLPIPFKLPNAAAPNRPAPTPLPVPPQPAAIQAQGETGLSGASTVLLPTLPSIQQISYLSSAGHTFPKR